MVTSLQFVQVGGIWASGAARKCGRKFAGVYAGLSKVAITDSRLHIAVHVIAGARSE